ncbi:unnamed protein product [Enterobius vermicularis]|uniref:Methionine synthase reductase n=1 Tax=Enterobius vermicularis TaxID=51028 RepID=A0A0N4V0G4_ENTVE|nr:unnamed protein product [Enterobius vermicularis]
MQACRGRCLILYGSQTGQSKAVAEILAERCRRLGLETALFELDDRGAFIYNDVFKFRIEQEPLVIVICSSTGSGDPPDNAVRFMRWISRRNQPEDLLQSTSFMLLGLGDSNYTSFQGVPRKIEKCLLRLGAKKLVETGFADDQVGLEVVVEPWLDKAILRIGDWFQLPSKEIKELITTSIQASEDKSRTLERLKISTTELGKKMEEPEDMSYEEEEDEEEAELEEVVLKPTKTVWPTGSPSLVKGTESLTSAELQVPVPQMTYLASSVTHEKFDSGTALWQNGFRFPGAIQEVFIARVVGTIELTKPGAAKMKREIHIDVGDLVEKINFEPGDALYFIVPNPREEVNLILERMNLLTVANQKCLIRVHPRTEKKDAALPGYIPEISSLREIFTYCLDIRRSPSRPLLRCLAETAKDAGEKRRLLELCSAQGTSDFTTYVRQAGISLADLLFAFPSCRPSADRLIELLPRLQPRPYTICSTKASWGSRLRFIYSLMPFQVSEGRQYHRYGLCSGWLSTLKIGDNVKVLLKEPARFRLPPPSVKNVDIRKIPLIMIGPGTGIAPFLCFLEHIYNQKSDDTKEDVTRELYFGCRRFDVDCICRREMEFFEKVGVLTHLDLCESQPRDEGSNATPRYVQDALLLRGKQIADMISGSTTSSEQPARIYVCGDAKGMAKDVFSTFIRIIHEHTGKTEEEARQFMETLVKEDHYLEDAWA